MIPFSLHIVAGLVLALQLLALVIARGTVDHVFYYRLLRGESRTPHWLARPIKLGPVEGRPYHALLFAFDAASVYALHLFAPVLALPYAVTWLFGCADALVYHLWKFQTWKHNPPNDAEHPSGFRTRLPVPVSIHTKLYVWPIQVALFRLVVGRWTTMGEYRGMALVGLLAALALLY